MTASCWEADTLFAVFEEDFRFSEYSGAIPPVPAAGGTVQTLRPVVLDGWNKEPHGNLCSTS